MQTEVATQPDTSSENDSTPPQGTPSPVGGAHATHLTPEDGEDRHPTVSASAVAAGWSGSDRQLTKPQRMALSTIKALAGEDVALCVTNPLVPTNPILFVNVQWQLMTGLTNQQAEGQPTSVTNGRETDMAVTESIGRALAQRHACKALLRSYRAGRPFWCMLSISPVLHGNEVLLWLTSTQDYSEHVAKLRVRTPTQFCARYRTRRISCTRTYTKFQSPPCSPTMIIRGT